MNLETRKLFSRWIPGLVGVVFCTIFFRSNMSKHSFPLRDYWLRNTDFCNLQSRKFYILNMPSLTLSKAVNLTERHEIAALLLKKRNVPKRFSIFLLFFSFFKEKKPPNSVFCKWMSWNLRQFFCSAPPDSQAASWGPFRGYHLPLMARTTMICQFISV